MGILTLEEYVRNKSGNRFNQVDVQNKIKYLSEYLADIISYFELKVEKLERNIGTQVLKKVKKEKAKI